MSKDKISAQDIIDAIALKANVTKALADDFFRAFVAAVEEALLARDAVKIKDFGTFKLTWIAPRKSVNVQTGEDILIDGYYKVVFVPEKGLKEQVNLPFAHLEPVALDGDAAEAAAPAEEPGPLAALSEQADEIKGLLLELSAMSASIVSEEAPLLEDAPAPMPAEPAAAPSLPAEESRVEPAAVEDDLEVAPLADADAVLPVPVKKRRVLPWVLLAVVLVFGAVTASYFLCMPVQHWMNKVMFGHDTAAYDAMREALSVAKDPTDGDAPSESGTAAVDAFQEAFDHRFDHIEYITNERLTDGSRLAYLAKRHYGSPYFWVYIYEVNTDRISDPDCVHEDSLVRIPKVDPLLIDVNNPRAMEAALELRKKYLKE